MKQEKDKSFIESTIARVREANCNVYGRVFDISL